MATSTRNAALITALIEREYVPSILANSRHSRKIREAMGVPLPPEPEGLSDKELALWYLDLLSGLPRAR